MAEEFDLVAEVPPFPAYALPPDVFPGFSAGSYGGSARGSTGIANVEYVYRPDYDVRGRIVGVSNTRPSDGGELLRQSPLWWASAKARIEETMTGEFPIDGGVVTGVGARYMGEASAEVEGTPCQLQRWTTMPEQISRGRPERGVCAVGPALPVRACHPASNHLITADSRSWGHDSTWLEWGHADLIPPAANQPAPINTIDVGARRVPGGAAASGPGERNLPRPPKSPIPGEKR